MVTFLLRRVVAAVPTLLAVVTLVFFAIRLAPGDPARAVLGEDAAPEVLARMRATLGLDDPLPLQYGRYLLGVLHGDLGTSFASGQPVRSQIAAVLPYTLELTFASIFIGVLLGIPLGVSCALRRNTWVDYAGRVAGLVGLSFPAFFSAILLILVFALGAGWFPVITELDMTHPGVRLRNLVLPAFSLGLLMAAYVSRATRAAMLEVLGEDYILAARAKGVPERVLIWRHALRNALIPIVTVVGLYLGLLIGNSVLTELVFNRPGIGRLIVNAVEQRDYAMLQGLLIVFGLCITVANLLTDLAYAFVDPRVSRR